MAGIFLCMQRKKIILFFFQNIQFKEVVISSYRFFVRDFVLPLDFGTCAEFAIQVLVRNPTPDIRHRIFSILPY